MSHKLHIRSSRHRGIAIIFSGLFLALGAFALMAPAFAFDDAGLLLSQNKGPACDVHDGTKRQVRDVRNHAQTKDASGKLKPVLSRTRDQNDMGYCYAYAAADMLEVWLKKKNQMPQDQNVSALAMALHDQSKKLRDPKLQAYLEASIKQKQLFLGDFPQLRKNLETAQSNLEKYQGIHGTVKNKSALYENTTERENALLNQVKKAEAAIEAAMKPVKVEIPDGGYISNSIEVSWPTDGSPNQICYESEFRSRA
ncbi:MAG: hypothetical protein KGQ59_12620, partial [Bdellovibrionales bacterium]|nr:hypothetical protein [Bdellovibrionales bacterium]